MSDQKQQMLNALDDLGQTTKILINALLSGNNAKSHEAITILLQQGLSYFGAESVVMQQFFPVFDQIKRHVDGGDLSSALGQTRVFERQLNEIIELVRNG
jgi:3-hydroxyisobutyrate dehydrogenase-like beta-hydroxyacid dehydrogenase